MGKGLFTFTTGIILGFTAGVMIDNEKKKKLKELAKNQTDKIKGYEKLFHDAITKIKHIIENKTHKIAKTEKKK